MKTHRLLITAAAMVLAAGSVAPGAWALQQQQQRPGQPGQPGARPTQPEAQQRPLQPGMTEQAATGVYLIRSETAIGANVTDAAGDSLGSINDLVLDSGNNRISHAVISYGGVLGIGSRTVAIPWRSLSWNAEEEEFRLNMTREQLDQAPEFDADSVRDPARRDRAFGFFRDRDAAVEDDGWSGSGQYQQMIQQGRPMTIQGTVSNIERRAPLTGMAEGIVITIRDEQQQRDVQAHLGPAWFIDRQDVMLRLNEQAQIQGMVVNLEGQEVLVAGSLSSQHGEFRLRDQQGHPAWDASQPSPTGQFDRQPGMDRDRQQFDRDQPGQQDRPGMQPGQQDRPGMQPGQQDRPGMQPGAQRDRGVPQDDPFGERRQAAATGRGTMVMVSDFNDQTVRTAGPDDLGDVSDVVFDAFSGQMAFIVVNVSGFLGLDTDAHAAIPFTLFRVQPDGELTIQQIDRGRLAAAPRVEDNDWRELRQPQFAEQVFQHFGQRSPFQQQPQQPGLRPAPGTGRDGLDRPDRPQQPARPDQPERPDRPERPERPDQPRAEGQGAQDYQQQFARGQPAQVSGTVQNVQPTTPGQGMEQILTVTVTGDDGRTQQVHLAPINHLERNNIELRNGDRISVTGRSATINGQPVIIAQTIEKDGQSANLRQNDGTPAWGTGR